MSGGHRCEAAAPTEAGAETGDRLRWRGLITHYALHIEILRHFVPQNDIIFVTLSVESGLTVGVGGFRRPDSVLCYLTSAVWIVPLSGAKGLVASLGILRFFADAQNDKGLIFNGHSEEQSDEESQCVMRNV